MLDESYSSCAQSMTQLMLIKYELILCHTLAPVASLTAERIDTLPRVALGFHLIWEPSLAMLSSRVLTCGFHLGQRGPLLMAPLLPSPQPLYTYIASSLLFLKRLLPTIPHRPMFSGHPLVLLTGPN